MRVDWSDHALEQVEEIFAYIVRDRPSVTVDIVDGVFDTTARLRELPEMGPPYPPADDPNVRFILFKTYRVVYCIEQGCVFISSVRHTRQDAGQEA